MSMTGAVMFHENLALCGFICSDSAAAVLTFGSGRDGAGFKPVFVTEPPTRCKEDAQIEGVAVQSYLRRKCSKGKEVRR
jgi:hypothetical protein